MARSTRSAMNITPMRVKALQLISDHPGIYLGALAERLEYRGRYDNGKLVLGSAQGATRWGGGYAAPLVKAGLVLKDSHVECGGARLYLTDDGEKALAEATAPTLEQALKGD